MEDNSDAEFAKEDEKILKALREVKIRVLAGNCFQTNGEWKKQNKHR